MKIHFKKSIRPKFLTIYLRSDGHMYLVPSSFNNDNWIVEVDYIKELLSETDNSLFLSAMLETLTKCNVLEPLNLKDKSQLSPICRVAGYKTYSRAVKGMRIIAVKWIENKGYIITPTKKKREKVMSILMNTESNVVKKS